MARKKFIIQEVDWESRRPGSLVFLPFSPVQSIAKIGSRQGFVECVDASGTDYDFIGASVKEIAESAKFFAYDSRSGRVEISGSRGFARVLYNVGYGIQGSDDLPSDIVLAALDWLKYEYERYSSGATSMINVSFGGFSATGQGQVPR